MPLPEKATRAELAWLFDTTERTITNYRQEGIPCNVRGTRVAYPLVRCVKWLLEKERKAAAGDGGESVRQRRAAAELRKIELEVAQTEGTLIALEVHELRIEKLSERLAAAVKGLGRFAGDVQRATTDIEAAELLERMSDDLLRALMGVADDLDDLIDADEDDDAPAAAAAAAD